MAVVLYRCIRTTIVMLLVQSVFSLYRSCGIISALLHSQTQHNICCHKKATPLTVYIFRYSFYRVTFFRRPIYGFNYMRITRGEGQITLICTLIDSEVFSWKEYEMTAWVHGHGSFIGWKLVLWSLNLSLIRGGTFIIFLMCLIRLAQDNGHHFNFIMIQPI